MAVESKSNRSCNHTAYRQRASHFDGRLSMNLPGSVADTWGVGEERTEAAHSLLHFDGPPKHWLMRQVHKRWRMSAVGGKWDGRRGRHFTGAAFEGGKFGILAFALQCVSVYELCSVHWGWALPVGGAAPRTFAPGGNNPRTATAYVGDAQRHRSPLRIKRRAGNRGLPVHHF